MNKNIQTEDPRFVRDVHSKALLNTDKDALNKHRLERMAAAKLKAQHDEARETQAAHHKQLQELSLLQMQPQEISQNCIAGIETQTVYGIYAG